MIRRTRRDQEIFENLAVPEAANNPKGDPERGKKIVNGYRRFVRYNWVMAAAIWARVLLLAAQCERTMMLGLILIFSMVSLVVCFIINQYFSVTSVDAISSLVWVPKDCFPNWGLRVGRHCFNDYAEFTVVGVLPNPWDPYKNTYPAGALLPLMTFAGPAAWLHTPMAGLFAYLLALTIAVLIPAVWAAWGARGLERVVVFLALGAVAVPAWMAIDRGNSVGFIAPIGLVFLVALRRQRWGLVAAVVIVGALVKPQFAVLAAVFFAVRQWRMGGVAVSGIVLSNLAAYLLWPRDFPGTIVTTIHNLHQYGSSSPALTGINNLSFASGVLLIPDHIMRMKMSFVPPEFLAGPRSVIGNVVLVVVVLGALLLGRRIPPVMAGVALLAGAALFPAVAGRYYLVFALAVAALIVRDPEGAPGVGIFDHLGHLGDRRRWVGVWLSLACAVSIAQIALPGGPGETQGATPIVATTAIVAPILWLVACGAILLSYARRPAGHVDAQSLPSSAPSGTRVGV